MGANRSSGYIQVDDSKSVSNPSYAEMLRNNGGDRSIDEEKAQGGQNQFFADDHVILDIDSQINIDLRVHERDTIWNRLLSPQKAEYILKAAQSTKGLVIGGILVVLYCIGLHTFDRGEYGWLSIIASSLILPVTVPACILYFGTLNVQICISILKQGTFWWKMSNVFVCNCMSVIWAWHNLEFKLISKEWWFTIYGLYFFVNVLATSMGCLLDGFRWSRSLRIIGPILLSLYFFESAFYWHYQSHSTTTVKLHVMGYKEDYLISYVAASCAFNAAVFLFCQGLYVIFFPNKASVIQSTVSIQWQPPLPK